MSHASLKHPRSTECRSGLSLARPQSGCLRRDKRLYTPRRTHTSLLHEITLHSRIVCFFACVRAWAWAPSLPVLSIQKATTSNQSCTVWLTLSSLRQNSLFKLRLHSKTFSQPHGEFSIATMRVHSICILLVGTLTGAGAASLCIVFKRWHWSYCQRADVNTVSCTILYRTFYRGWLSWSAWK